MALIIYPIKYLNMNDIIVIILQVIIGALIYFCGSKILKLDTYSYILDIIKDKFTNNLEHFISLIEDFYNKDNVKERIIDVNKEN